MRIALASYPGAELISKDDELLSQAIRALGAAPEVCFWSDPDVDWSRFETVALRTTWDYHFHLEAFLSWVDRTGHVTRVVNSPSLVSWNAHKAYLLELERLGVPTVPTHVISEIDEVAQVIATLDSATVVLKPEVGASAVNTFVIARERTDELSYRLRGILATGKALLQPYFEQIETEGELSLVWIDGQVTHAIQKRPQPGDFRVQVDHGGTNERIESPADGIALAHQCIEALPELPCFARVDAVRDSQGTLRLMELELIEPELMFEWAPESATKLAMALLEP